MTMPDSQPLIGPDEPDPVAVVNASGRSPFLIIGDHAGNAIPRILGTLGLGQADRERHIAWDIGVQGLGEMLAARLDAVFIAQRYSRLVIDCNRAPGSADAVPWVSDGTTIPRNVGISQSERDLRVSSIHRPYQDRISTELDGPAAWPSPTLMLALHSFTPKMQNIERPWHAGILHSEGETGFALALLSALRQITDLTVGDNEPYQMDTIDYTVPHQCFPRGVPYAEIEVRQDLLADAAGQARWADILYKTVRAAATGFL